jgi:predicted NBD/HSP70 family sugar kinase
MTVDPNGSPCRCGSVGCWETVVGGGALLALAGQPRESGRAGIDTVLREAAEGSASAVSAVDHVGRWLGLGLASLVNVLDPRLIVLGGLFGRIYPFVIRPLTLELDRRALPASRALVRVVPATLGVDAPLLGAAELAFEPLLADPAMWVEAREALTELASA